MKYKNTIFVTYYSVISILMAFPPFITWANRIEPMIVGLPFSMFYLFSLVGLMSVGIIVQYIVEDRLGELDVTVDMPEQTEELGGENN
ncbi:hypothetical protein [Sporosarcina cascadiensis]|uniref:hypothetical protein n=1 Tax=Sporosarcina cascadiensis TaxID=2660747 RepID=UPI00129B9487|nr:hypothetical protein [Sporosarcina cascadiensis]